MSKMALSQVIPYFRVLNLRSINPSQRSSLQYIEIGNSPMVGGNMPPESNLNSACSLPSFYINALPYRRVNDNPRIAIKRNVIKGARINLAVGDFDDGPSSHHDS